LRLDLPAVVHYTDVPLCRWPLRGRGLRWNIYGSWFACTPNACTHRLYDSIARSIDATLADYAKRAPMLLCACTQNTRTHRLYDSSIARSSDASRYTSLPRKACSRACSCVRVCTYVPLVIPCGTVCCFLSKQHESLACCNVFTAASARWMCLLWCVLFVPLISAHLSR
jgi:hypothetical protein